MILNTFVQEQENEYLKRLGDALNPCQYIADKIFKEIVENPPALAIKGGNDQ
jgi:DNA mismatch repair protein MutS